MKVNMIARDGAERVGGIVTHTYSLVPELEKLGIKVEVHVGGSALRTSLLPFIEDLTDCDILHVQAPPYGPYLKRLGRPVVCTVHSPLSEELTYYPWTSKAKAWMARYWERKTIRESDAVIAVSEYTRSLLEADSKAVVVPNGVDLDLYRPEKTPGSQPKFLVCSRNDPRKNLPLTMDAVGYLGSRVQPLLALGGVPSKQVESWYRVADIFLTTSYSEGFNLTLLQGMAAGCACIASDIPAHRELIEDGKDGLLFNSPSAMKEELDRVLSDPSLRETLGVAARAKASSYSWKRTAEMTAAVYSGLVGKA